MCQVGPLLGDLHRGQGVERLNRAQAGDGVWMYVSLGIGSANSKADEERDWPHNREREWVRGDEDSQR